MPKDLLKTFEFASFSQVFDYNIKTFKKKILLRNTSGLLFTMVSQFLEHAKTLNVKHIIKMLDQT